MHKPSHILNSIVGALPKMGFVLLMFIVGLVCMLGQEHALYASNEDSVQAPTASAKEISAGPEMSAQATAFGAVVVVEGTTISDAHGMLNARMVVGLEPQLAVPETGKLDQNTKTAPDNTPPNIAAATRSHHAQQAPTPKLKAVNLPFQNLTGLAHHNGVATPLANGHNFKNKAVAHHRVATNWAALCNRVQNTTHGLALNTAGSYAHFLVHYIANRPPPILA